MDTVIMTALKVNATAAGRRPGRPRGQTKSHDRREHLLDIALNLFARKGIAETSLNAIAKEASVTPAVLHYYFNTREQLLDVMIEERFLPLRSDIAAVFTAHANAPREAIRALVHKIADAARCHPWFAPLWLQEVTSDAGVLRQQMYARHGSAERQMALDTLRRWQDEGKLHRDLEPALVFTSLLSLILVPLAAQSRPAQPALSAEIIERHALILLEHGLNA
jgi:AcrR family transcriptional regulator